MKHITRTALVFLVLIAVAQSRENTKAQSWLKHDCNETQMVNFLNSVETEFLLLTTYVNMANAADCDAGSTMAFLVHEGHVIDQMEKPNCYDATQVVNVSYWIITAYSESFFGGMADDYEIIDRAEKETEQGINALSMIFAEYGLEF